jgi:transposase
MARKPLIYRHVYFQALEVGPGGGKRKQDMRAVMNGVKYILSTGCQWRYLPKDFPPRSTVHNYFIWWHCDGVLDRIHHALYIECREQAEREGSPTACIIDSQSVKSAEKGGRIDPHGFDAGKGETALLTGLPHLGVTNYACFTRRCAPRYPTTNASRSAGLPKR